MVLLPTHATVRRQDTCTPDTGTRPQHRPGRAEHSSHRRASRTLCPETPNLHPFSKSPTGVTAGHNPLRGTAALRVSTQPPIHTHDDHPARSSHPVWSPTHTVSQMGQPAPPAIATNLEKAWPCDGHIRTASRPSQRVTRPCSNTVVCPSCARVTHGHLLSRDHHPILGRREHTDTCHTTAQARPGTQGRMLTPASPQIWGYETQG